RCGRSENILSTSPRSKNGWQVRRIDGPVEPRFEACYVRGCDALLQPERWRTKTLCQQSNERLGFALGLAPGLAFSETSGFAFREPFCFPSLEISLTKTRHNLLFPARFQRSQCILHDLLAHCHRSFSNIAQDLHHILDRQRRYVEQEVETLRQIRA